MFFRQSSEGIIKEVSYCNSYGDNIVICVVRFGPYSNSCDIIFLMPSYTGYDCYDYKDNIKLANIKDANQVLKISLSKMLC
jgi:hypothetical protein